MTAYAQKNENHAGLALHGLCDAFQASVVRNSHYLIALRGKKEDLDEQWRIQQEILALRRNPRAKSSRRRENSGEEKGSEPESKEKLLE